MKENTFLKILTSLPVILIFLYFIPFLGFCLILLRAMVCSRNKKLHMYLIIIGILVFIPYFLDLLFKSINFDSSNILYFDSIINSSLYKDNFISFGKMLLIVGVLYMIIMIIYNKAISGISSGIRKYINESERKDYEISQKNDLLMKEKREKALNTHVVICPFCGSDNIFAENVGTCKFCRRKIEK